MAAVQRTQSLANSWPSYLGTDERKIYSKSLGVLSTPVASHGEKTRDLINYAGRPSPFGKCCLCVIPIVEYLPSRVKEVTQAFYICPFELRFELTSATFSVSILGECSTWQSLHYFPIFTVQVNVNNSILRNTFDQNKWTKNNINYSVFGINRSWKLEHYR